jgi:arylsulfatase A-like enzyme
MPAPVVLSRRQILALILFGVGLALLMKAVHRYRSWKPNVVLISIDTVRTGRLGCYGFTPSPSPTIDRIARESYVFEQCYAPCSWTMPSVMSMLTGLYPFNHGLEWVNGRLAPEAKTLAEYLRESGYRTGGVESSLFLQSQFGFGRGFERYEEQPIHDHRAISSPSLTERALGWLHEVTGKPFFLWVHYLDPHYDYLYHPEARAFVEGAPEEELRKEYSILELRKPFTR